MPGSRVEIFQVITLGGRPGEWTKRVKHCSCALLPRLVWSGPYCELYCHAVCKWKVWNLPLSWFVYERIRLFTIYMGKPVGPRWANGSQNSGLVNFVPQSLLSFLQISSIYQKTTANAWTRYKRWLWSNGTRIFVWNIPSGKTGLIFQIFRCPRKFFDLNDPKSPFPFTSNRIFWEIR